MNQATTFHDSFNWKSDEFLFDSTLESLFVTAKSPGVQYQMGYYQIYCYALKDTGLTISYDPGSQEILVSNDVDFSAHKSFREFLVLEESATYASISLYNFEADPGHGHDAVPVISLRAGGLGIIDVSDTDPVYYKMMSYDFNQTQPRGDKTIQIKAVELSKGKLTRNDTYNNHLETRDLNVICFTAYYDVVS